MGVGVCVGVGLDVGDWGLTDEMGTLLFITIIYFNQYILLNSDVEIRKID